MTGPSTPLLQIDRHGDEPVTRQLVAQLRAAIVSGELAPGRRLPPSRELARQTGIGRHPVVQAYEQLATEGWLDADGRHGTFVATRGHARAAAPQAPAIVRRLEADAAEALPAWKDWRLGQACTVALPLDVWRAACREAGRHLPPSDYGDPRGDPGLRAAIARWLDRERGLTVTPERIVVTAGAGQAIDLLAQVLLREGDACVVENPGYPRAAQAFLARGARVRAVAVDDAGLVVEDAFSGRVKPALLHVTAAHQYPLGISLSGPRRQALRALARTHGCLVVENEYDHEFVHGGPRHAPICASAPDRTVLVSTFAKALTPALRLGFVVAPEPIAQRLAALVARERRHVSWPIQQAVRWIIDSGEMARHLRRVRRNGLHLLQRIQARLAPHAKTLAIGGDAGGLHVVLRARTPGRAAALGRALGAAGVAFDTVAAFETAPSASMRDHGLLFAYGHLRAGDLDRALALLADAMDKMSRR